MITAEEAKQLSGPPNVKDYLAFIEERIISAAKNKQNEVYIREKPYCWWLYNSDKMDTEAKKTIGELKSFGFDISLYYNESQFVDVDVALHIQW